MIDTKELRRLAQEAMHPVTKGRWMRLFGERTVYDRMEDGCRGIPVVSTPVNPPHPFEAACLDFIAAANPTAISELLDRLEAAEKSDAESLAMYRRARDERDALRAKVTEMERQEPVAWARKLGMDLPSFGCVTDLKYRPSDMPESAYMPLYALPGAQPAPSVPMDVIADYLVSISAHLARRDDAKAQAEIGELLKMIAPAPKPAPSVPDTYAAGINAVAAILQSKADEYAKEHGHDDMGGLSFGPGMGGEIKMDYYTNLIELVDDVRAMLADAPEAKP